MGASIGAILTLGWVRFQFSNRAVLADTWNQTSPLTSTLPRRQLVADESQESTRQQPISLSRQNAIVKAASVVGPAVVSISVVQTRIVQTGPFGDLFDEFWGNFFPRRQYKQQIQSIGSGVIISQDGYVLTNEHVVENADKIKVTLPSGKEYAAKLVGEDLNSDLAVLKIEGENLPFAKLGDSDNLLIGEWAIAIGNPFGYLLDDPHPTVTAGVISALNRDFKRTRGQERVYRKMIQTDAAINPGNSGGPLVNADGEVIGINTFIFTTSRGSEGIGFAIPINRARVIMDDLIRRGTVISGWIGIQVQNITPLLAQSLNLTETKGAIIANVEDQSPGARAGLKRGDIVIKAANKKINNLNDWDEVASLVRPGKTLELAVVREGKLLTLQVNPEEVPPQSAQKIQSWLGIRVSNITPRIARQLGLRNRQGVLVTAVADNSPAAELGLAEGDIIRQVNDWPVDDLETYEKILSRFKSGQNLVLLVERDGRLFWVSAVV